MTYFIFEYIYIYIIYIYIDVLITEYNGSLLCAGYCRDWYTIPIVLIKLIYWYFDRFLVWNIRPHYNASLPDEPKCICHSSKDCEYGKQNDITSFKPCLNITINDIKLFCTWDKSVIPNKFSLWIDSELISWPLNIKFITFNFLITKLNKDPETDTINQQIICDKPIKLHYSSNSGTERNRKSIASFIPNLLLFYDIYKINPSDNKHVIKWSYCINKFKLHRIKLPSSIYFEFKHNETIDWNFEHIESFTNMIQNNIDAQAWNLKTISFNLNLIQIIMEPPILPRNVKSIQWLGKYWLNGQQAIYKTERITITHTTFQRLMFAFHPSRYGHSFTFKFVMDIESICDNNNKTMYELNEWHRYGFV